MPSIQSQEENFVDAERKFDLQRLKAALEEAKQVGEISEAPWRYFKGVLCLGEPEEVAKRCQKRKGTVFTELKRGIKPYLLIILQRSEDERIVWNRVSKWLIDAGYGLSEVSWQRVCREMWQKQKKTQRIRRQVTEKGFEVNVHVGLGLIQREQQQRRQGYEYDRSQIHNLTDQEAIVRRFEHNEFLAEVIEQSSKANKHVAIIGEPGAGKTTLLAAIADHLSRPTSAKLPICVSLAGLQKKTLQDYLLQVWLPEAFHLVYADIAIDETHRTAFQDWLRQGEVWLLLDGVDEMGEEYPAVALNTIKTQLIDWLGNVRVALNCRSNVWDAQLNNPLSGAFDVYKTQEFKPKQIEDFMQQWFSQSKKPERGQALQQKLNEPQRERVRELIRNPLRLSLLCQAFYTNPNEDLPQTKAGLYEIFVRDFYEWKLDQHPTKEPQREKLNKALGKLALGGLNNEHGLHRFRLPEKAARKVMGNKPFELAEKLGWLNIVDQDADSSQAVYAFFHPTFQEYFAALAIDDWDYFLPFNHEDKPAKNRKGECCYRIFESPWKEVALLWLGQPESKVCLESKNSFIEQLLYFEDGSGKLYWFQLYFFAAIAIMEFEYGKAFEIVDWLVKEGFGYFDSNNREWEVVHSWSATEARKAVIEAKSSLSITALIERIHEGNCEVRRWAAWGLGKIALNHPKAVDALISLISLSTPDATSYQYDSAHLQAIESIGKIAKNNSSAINTLLNLLSTRTDIPTQIQAAESLGKISQSHLLRATEDLIEFMSSEHDIFRCRAACSLWEIDNKYLDGATEVILEVINKDADPFINLRAVDYLRRINPAHPELIRREMPENFIPATSEQIVELIQLTLDAPDENSRDYISISFLGKMGALDSERIKSLIEMLQAKTDYLVCSELTDMLIKIIQKNQFEMVVSNLNSYLSEDVREADPDLHYFSSKILWHCAQNMSYPEFYYAWHSPLSITDSAAIADRPS